MHELGVAESILEITLRHSRGAKVDAVRLVIGELSTYLDNSITFFWDELSKGTLAEGSRLEFRQEPGGMDCYVESIEVEDPQ